MANPQYQYQQTQVPNFGSMTASTAKAPTMVTPSTNFMQVVGPFTCFRCKSQFETEEAVNTHFGTSYKCSGKPDAWIIEKSRMARKLAKARGRRNKLQHEQNVVDRILGFTKLQNEVSVLKARVDVLTRENEALNSVLNALKKPSIQ